MRLEQLIERDEAQCWICENDVDLNAPSASPNAPSVDHITPRARGGKTTDDNVRLAHRRCNTRRGSKVPELQWPPAETMVDAAPLWQSIQRLSKKSSKSEVVAIFGRRDEAETFASWLVEIATRITGKTWTVTVDENPLGHALSLEPASD